MSSSDSDQDQLVDGQFDMEGDDEIEEEMLEGEGEEDSEIEEMEGKHSNQPKHPIFSHNFAIFYSFHSQNLIIFHFRRRS